MTQPNTNFLPHPPKGCDNLIKHDYDVYRPDVKTYRHTKDGMIKEYPDFIESELTGGHVQDWTVHEISNGHCTPTAVTPVPAAFYMGIVLLLVYFVWSR